MAQTDQGLGKVGQIDEGRVKAHLDEMVRSTVEETRNTMMLDADRWRCWWPHD